MNKKIFENARFCPKGDIEANWNKAVGFVPLKKEIIEYLPDENHPVVRFKVGDGVTVVQDLPFAGVDDREIKAYIDSKIEAIPQVDYEQNDPAAADYIKNRPFYEAESIITEEIINESISEEHYDWHVDTSFSEKDVFDITLNGVEYSGLTCRYTAEDNQYCYGNLALVKMGDDTGEPFIFACGIYKGAPVCVIITTIDVSGGVPIIVTQHHVGTNIKQLDEKFIPNNIARITDIPEQVQTDYDQNNSTAVDYIKNRPCYGDKVIKYPATTYMPGKNWSPDGRWSPWRLLTDKQDAITDEAIVHWNRYELDDLQTNIITIQEICGAEEAKQRNLIKWSAESSTWLVYDDEYMAPGSRQVTAVDMPEVYDTSNFKELDEKYIPDSIARTHVTDVLANNIATLHEEIYTVSDANKKYVDDAIANVGGGGTKLYIHTLYGASMSYESDYTLFLICNQSGKFSSNDLPQAFQSRIFHHADLNTYIFAKFGTYCDIISSSQNGKTSTLLTFADGTTKQVDFSESNLANYTVAEL